jgi:hypothetical protein
MITPAQCIEADRKRIEALEQLLGFYLGPELNELQRAAHGIVDLMSGDMTEETKNACWILLRFIADKKTRLTADTNIPQTEPSSSE